MQLPHTSLKPSAANARVLWRMQGPERVVSANLYRKSNGYQLIVGFEGDESGIIEAQFDSVGPEALTARAETLKAVLHSKGWLQR